MRGTDLKGTDVINAVLGGRETFLVADQRLHKLLSWTVRPSCQPRCFKKDFSYGKGQVGRKGAKRQTPMSFIADSQDLFIMHSTDYEYRLDMIVNYYDDI